MEKKRTTFSLKEILPGVIQKMAIADIQEQSDLEEHWRRLTAADEGKVMFSGYKDGTIFATVDSAARLFKMRMQKQTLLTKVQKQRSDVKNIVFKIGKVT